MTLSQEALVSPELLKLAKAFKEKVTELVE